MDLVCEKCGNMLLENNIAAAKEYNKDIKLLVQKDGKPSLKTLPKYFIFLCPVCANIKKISFEDYFISRQQSVLDIVLDLRLSTSMLTLDRRNISEDSVFAYCGVCKGPYDGDGYCKEDVMAICEVRRRILES